MVVLNWSLPYSFDFSGESAVRSAAHEESRKFYLSSSMMSVR